MKTAEITGCLITEVCDALIKWLQTSFGKSFNTVVADPFDFSSSEKRFSVKGNKIT